jgi:hypothetical protein
MRQRLDDTGAKSRLSLSEAALRPTNSLSEIESFQFVPIMSYATVIWPLVLSSRKACLSAFMTSSVTIKPRLSAWRDVARPP